MPQLNRKQASLYALLVFLVTLGSSYLVPGHAILTGGFLVIILLSVFIEDKLSTIVAAFIGLLFVFGRLYFSEDFFWDSSGYGTLLFTGFLFVFTAGVVLYIKRLYADMREDKTHMSSLYENATEGIILCNASGNIVLINPAVRKMFGYSVEELSGAKVEKLIPAAVRGHHVDLRKGFIAHPQNRRMGSGRDLFAERKDGSRFPVEVSLSYYQEQSEFYVIAFIVDITRRKEIEQNMLQQKEELQNLTEEMRLLNTQLEAKVEERTAILQEALESLEVSQKELNAALSKEKELNEIKSRFVSMASHEFRTPLSTVLSSATLLSKYKLREEDDKRERHIRKIRDSVGYLNDLLEDFLSLGKLEEGKVGVHPSSFDFDEFIDDILDELKPLLKEGQYFQCKERAIEGSLYTDKRMMKNILLNIISNAVKFSPENAGIVINVKIKNEELNLEVCDSGVGIPPEDLAHLFDNFFRASNVTNIQGTGLGLPIVKRYLDLLGGSISVESELQKGTRVVIILPPYKETTTGRNNFTNAGLS